LNDLYRTRISLERAQVLQTRVTHRFEYTLVGFISDTISQGEIDRVVPSFSESDILDVSSSREEFSVFVERTGHDSISRVEGFFDSVSVMNIDIDV
jgi:hypothetical protein